MNSEEVKIVCFANLHLVVFCIMSHKKHHPFGWCFLLAFSEFFVGLAFLRKSKSNKGSPSIPHTQVCGIFTDYLFTFHFLSMRHIGIGQKEALKILFVTNLYRLHIQFQLATSCKSMCFIESSCSFIIFKNPKHNL